MLETALLDVDGTLVDTNYHHALAWHRALRAHGYAVRMSRVHRHVGMGGDQIVTALAGEEIEHTHGDELRAAEARAYAELIDEVEVVAGASELIDDLRAAGTEVVLASSAKPEEVDHYLELLDARDRVDAWTSAADVERTKPAPDLVRAALEKSGTAPGSSVLVGDSVWDVRAARTAGVPTIAVLTGGFSEAELREAGAAEVVESVEQVRFSPNMELGGEY